MYLSTSKPLILLFALFFCLSTKDSKGQNLVPNGDFEEHSGCPHILSIFYTNVSDWYGGIAINVDPNSTSEGASNWPSPDWFHSCGTPGILSTPLNIGGYQAPSNGDAYGGFINYTSEDEYREIISVPLTDTLEAGEAYTLTFSLTRGSTRQNHFANNRIGFRMTTFEYYTHTEQLVSSWTHGEIEEVVIDTTNWQEYSFDFIADSSYQYLHIGNFYPTSELEINLDEGDFELPPLLAYYFIDGVSLVRNESLSISPENQSGLKVYPNPSNGVFQVSLEDGHVPFEVTIYDLNGKSILQKTFRDSEATLDISMFGPGLYTVVVSTDRDVSTQRILVK